MNLKKFVIQEIKGFNLFEKIFFPLEILLIIVISIILNDNKIALISAIAGISYTILAGKGKISCYIIGLCGTFCYCYIAFKNGFYGNLALYGLYFFPMQDYNNVIHISFFLLKIYVISPPDTAGKLFDF